MTGSQGRNASAMGDVDFDMVIVGAGFAGMYMLHKARGMGMTARVFEAGDDVGGTWYWNRYPGARCDVDSFEYNYAFFEEIDDSWYWTERFAAQPEIFSYARHVADRLDLRRDITFETRIASAHWDDDAGSWTVTTDGGDSVTARFVVMATGCLSVPNLPQIEGVHDFAGEVFHTADWPRQPVDFSGKRVGIIGTGSSGCQTIATIAPQVGELYVFQRTANHCIPANNGPIEDEHYRHLKSNNKELREKWHSTPFGMSVPFGMRSALEVSSAERRAAYEARWQLGGLSFAGVFDDLLRNEEANRTASDFVAEKIREIVKDPHTADRLTARDHPLGTKRLALVIDYYEAFNRDNVHLISARDRPIDRIEPKGVVAGGELVELDMLIYATGYDAMSGALLAIDIRGRDGVSLRDMWAEGPESYLGLGIAGMPNLFIVTGPGSPSVLSNMIASIEQHVEWISDCLSYLRDNGIDRIEPTAQAQEEWMAHVDEVANETLFVKARSWYTGANIEGKPQRFTPYVNGFAEYRVMICDIAEHGYRGFALTRSPQSAAA